jgi:hypothetical protein
MYAWSFMRQGIALARVWASAQYVPRLLSRAIDNDTRMQTDYAQTMVAISRGPRVHRLQRARGRRGPGASTRTTRRH